MLIPSRTARCNKVHCSTGITAEAMGSQLIDALRHFEAGRLTEAAAACGIILHRAPRNWLALRLLGHVRNSERAYDQAAQHLAAALDAAPPDVPDVVGMLN